MPTIWQETIHSTHFTVDLIRDYFGWWNNAWTISTIRLVCKFNQDEQVCVHLISKSLGGQSFSFKLISARKTAFPHRFSQKSTTYSIHIFYEVALNIYCFGFLNVFYVKDARNYYSIASVCIVWQSITLV